MRLTPAPLSLAAPPSCANNCGARKEKDETQFSGFIFLSFHFRARSRDARRAGGGEMLCVLIKMAEIRGAPAAAGSSTSRESLAGPFELSSSRVAFRSAQPAFE